MTQPQQEFLEIVFRIALQVGVQITTKEEYMSRLQATLFQGHGISLSTHWLIQHILILRLMGLLKRRYYQTSALGLFFLENRLEVKSFLQLFQVRLNFALERIQSQKLKEQEYALAYIACAEWYLNILKTRNFIGPELDDFLLILGFTFEWTDKLPSYLEKKIEHILDEFLKEQFRARAEKVGTRFLSKYKPVKLAKQEQPPLPQPRKVSPGKVLKRVVEDIYNWLTETSIIYQKAMQSNDTSAFKKLSWIQPYIDIQKIAQKRSEDPYKIRKENYTRTTFWITRKRSLTKREKQFIHSLGNLEGRKKSLLEMIEEIRQNLQRETLRMKPNKPRTVLLHKHLAQFHMRYLYQTCETCIYFERHRGADCLFFRRLELIRKFRTSTVPSQLVNLINERTQIIFKKKVACLFWRSEEQEIVSLVRHPLGDILCPHCFHPLPALPTLHRPALCLTCETKYQIFPEKGAQKTKFEAILTKKHSIGHDLAIINHLLSVHANDPLELRLFLSHSQSQLFDPKVDSIESIFVQPPDYVYIDENATTNYVKPFLQVEKKFHDLRKLTFIDSQKWDRVLKDMLTDFPHIKFNFRLYNITLSPEDTACIVNLYSRTPILHVKRRFKKSVEIYPLHQLSTVYNVGKPRLTKFLKYWGVKVLYTSTKGILSHPKRELRTAIELPGVRQTLQQIHLKGLFLSLIYATIYLAQVAEKNNQKSFSDKFFIRLHKLLKRKAHYFDEKLNTPLTFKQAGLLEAWIARPFAEGIRTIVSKSGGKEQSLIQRSYGRTKARRINKKNKQGSDFLGGYTSFDSALNCINRHLRYLLRKWNAQLGLGFHTFPLFTHTSKDKGGRSGHLDLEEVGRIISRIRLIEAILSNELRRSNFLVQYDDNYLSFYVPHWRTQIKLRKNLVQDQIFSTELYYKGKWLPFEKAHKQHVQNLCNCLKKCLSLEKAADRESYLLKKYQPLIFHPRISDNHFMQEHNSVLSSL